MVDREVIAVPRTGQTRIAIAVLTLAMGGCTGLPGIATGPGKVVPPKPTPPRAVTTVNNPTPVPAGAMRPRIHIDDIPGAEFVLQIILAPPHVPCRVPDDPFWPIGHPRPCWLSASTR